jgi:assimilatory nitrate reductase catalytic subunit
MEARVVLEAGVGRGRVFIPMHDGAVNRLTLSVFDPYSRQPSYKACAVRLEPIGEAIAPG